MHSSASHIHVLVLSVGDIIFQVSHVWVLCKNVVLVTQESILGNILLFKVTTIRYAERPGSWIATKHFCDKIGWATWFIDSLNIIHIICSICNRFIYMIIWYSKCFQFQRYLIYKLDLFFTTTVRMFVTIMEYEKTYINHFRISILMSLTLYFNGW